MIRTAMTAILLAAAVLARAEEPETPKPPAVGDVAPDFALVDQDGKTVRLRDFRGKRNVVIAFFPKAFTGG
jgi:peroxiredoxin Q/BCP